MRRFNVSEIHAMNRVHRIRPSHKTIINRFVRQSELRHHLKKSFKGSFFGKMNFLLWD